MDYPSDPEIGLVGGKFTDGNPGGGVPASIDPAAWANAVTDEILAVIVLAGDTPDEGDNTQLSQAIAALIAAAVGAISSDNVYDWPFNAGFTSIMSALPLIDEQSYGEGVVARAFTATGESGYIGTAGTGAAVIVDIEKNGVSIYTTPPQFADGANTLTAGTLKSDGTQIFAAGDRISFRVKQIGSGTAGAALRFTLRGTVN